MKDTNKIAEELGNKIFALETNFDVFVNRLDTLNIKQLAVHDAIVKDIEGLKEIKARLLAFDPS